jgi:mannan endo-1,4-beta-mannosidase
MNIFKTFSSGITASIAALTVTTLSFVNTTNAALSNSNATQAAKNVYSYFENLPHGNNNSVLTGHFAGYSEQTFNMMQTTAVKNLAYDEWPAVLSGDYMNWSKTDWGGNASTTYCADQISYGCNSDLIKHYRAGGLVTISIHMPNPYYSTGETVKTEISNTNYASLTNHSSTYGVRWKDMLDRIAAGLKELQDAGVPVLFRPLHEMNGDWFWWGQENGGYNDTRANNFKALWQNMYTYFKDTKGLNNLIWIYSPDQSAEYITAYYPGNSYVDMVGLDAYTNDPSSSNLRNKYSTMRSNYSSKPFAFTEVGPSTTGSFNYGTWATAIRNYYSAACYFLAWNDSWGPQNNSGTSTLYNDGWMINRHEVNFTRPSWNPPSIPSGSTTFTDNCSNYNAVYQRSSSLSIDAGNTTYFNGDAGRFSRSALSTQYVTYNFSNISTFNVKVYHQDDHAGTSLKFFASSNNSTWTQIATSATSPVATSASWFSSNFTPVKLLPTGTNFLKIEWSTGTEYWTPQISELSIYYTAAGGTTYTVSASAGSNGSISPTSSTVASGANQTLTITPNSGYQIATLTDNGVSKTATNNTYTVSNVTSNRTIAVTFSATSGSTQLSISSVAASCDDGNVAANTIDGNLATRWACVTNGATITYTLPATSTINNVKIAWNSGNVRYSYYDIYTSTDGTNFTQYGSRYTSSGTTLELENNTINSVSARYIRIAGFGNSVNAWSSITELQIWGTSTAPTSTQLSISSAAASCDDGNVASNAIDGNTATRWACITSGATLTATLPATKTIKDVKIAWNAGNARVYAYDIYTSTDGTNFTMAGSRRASSGTTLELESNTINSVSGRYIRIACFGSNVSAWNSIVELQIWGN